MVFLSINSFPYLSEVLLTDLGGGENLLRGRGDQEVRALSALQIEKGAVCPKDSVVVMVNGFGAGSAIQHSHASHFPQEMHCLVLNFNFIPYVFWLCVTSAYFQLLRPFNY